MRFASCAHGGRTFAAALIDGAAVPLAGIPELGARPRRLSLPTRRLIGRGRYLWRR